MSNTRRINTQHRPVLLREVIESLALKPGLTVVDGTVGAAGHAAPIVSKLQPGGRLIGLDRDDSMLQRARSRLHDEATGNLPDTIELRQSSYADLPNLLVELGLPHVDRILVDLGLSSDQLADDRRGFGFATHGELDMRFDQTTGEPVHVWLNRASVVEMTTALAEFGEDPHAAQIAQQIDLRRRQSPILTVDRLNEIIAEVYGKSSHRSGKSNPATRTYQALRIVANAELEHLQRFLTTIAPAALPAGGILAVISFHSLEDRMVKQALADRAIWQSSSKKPVSASPLEIKMNPRSRSAKLRIGIRAAGQIDHISDNS